MKIEETGTPNNRTTLYHENEEKCNATTDKTGKYIILSSYYPGFEGEVHFDNIRAHLNDQFSGNLTSIAKDAEGTFGDVWKNISFSGSIPSATISIYVNTSSDNGVSDPWSGWISVTAPAVSGTIYDLPSANQERYVKWRLQLQTSDASKTPAIYNVTTDCAPRITSCDINGVEKNQFAPNETVYVKATVLEAITDYKIWIQNDPVSEGESIVADEDPSTTKGDDVTTDAQGDISATPIWSIPKEAAVTNTPYDIVVDDQDRGNVSTYNAADDGLDSAAVAGIVAPVPEVPTFILFGSGLILIYFISRRRKEEVK